MQFALNQMTTPNLGYAAFLDLAKALGCVGVEARNDLGREIFDGIAPEEAGRMARARGLRIVGVSQVYPFNVWSDEIEAAVENLITTAKAAGGETISLIPRNDGAGRGEAERRENMLRALRAIKPMLERTGMVALVEPLGFGRSSLRSKVELVAAIDELDANGVYKLVHDTFHHTLAGGGDLFPRQTGIVHLSGVVDPALAVDEMEDAHRVLVDAADRLGNIEQITALRDAGYDGVFSYECFSPEVHAFADPEARLRETFAFVTDRLAAPAAR
ncbi:MAG: sugar epimerase [Rhodovulum sulfidophilum]|uniref:Sugar epimerase n=1 Tax=Rhodovulum sulfidophilum TaxID=35806 RepID=A0A2W5N7Z6_RHOSU|nr:MAG: sugar epimerase [Rhodovulum sulfidophilum]